jgi:hypothetical protein
VQAHKFIAHVAREKHTMKSMTAALFGIVGIVVTTGAIAQGPEWMEHASWCLKPSGANRTLMEQSPTAGKCGALQAGILTAAWFGADEHALAVAMNLNQYQMGVYAADAACRRDPLSDQIAIRLLQVCQCHNDTAQSSIENNQTEVLDWLRGWRGGPPKNAPC